MPHSGAQTGQAKVFTMHFPYVYHAGKAQLQNHCLPFWELPEFNLDNVSSFCSLIFSQL